MLIFKIISKSRLNYTFLTNRLYLKIVLALIRTKAINNLVEQKKAMPWSGQKNCKCPWRPDHVKEFRRYFTQGPNFGRRPSELWSNDEFPKRLKS